MLVNCTTAARILNRRADLVRYYGETGKLRVARRSPMRFTLATVLAARESLPVVDRRKTGRRSRPESHVARILEAIS